MKQYIALFLSLTLLFLIFSCDMETGKIDSVEKAKTATEIFFEASYTGITECYGADVMPECLTITVPGGGVIELCLDSESALDESAFYNEIDFEQGLVVNISFSDVAVTYSKGNADYVLDGNVAAYGNVIIDGLSAEAMVVILGDVDIEGDTISDTAEFDVKYACDVTYTGSSFVITGSIEGTVNGYDVTNMDWEYTIQL